MKLLIATLILSLNVHAQSIADYHSTHQREVALYKTMNELNFFEFDVQFECNNDQYADWRIQQYDKKYMKCVNDNYLYVLSKISPNENFKRTPNDLYGENVRLSVLLKERALNNEGLEYVTDRHGRRFLELSDPKVTEVKIRNAANTLSLLVQEE